MVKASHTGGVKPMSITGRLTRERERLIGMSEEERMWRKQWLKDQELAPNEPRHVPEIYKALHNPIRRFYRYPLDLLGKALEPAVGIERAMSLRYWTGKVLMGVVGVYWATYYFKYCANDWTRKGGWKVIQSRAAVVEGDPGYPKLSDRSKPQDYANRGFKNLTLNL